MLSQRHTFNARDTSNRATLQETMDTLPVDMGYTETTVDIYWYVYDVIFFQGLPSDSLYQSNLTHPHT